MGIAHVSIANERFWFPGAVQLWSKVASGLKEFCIPFDDFFSDFMLISIVQYLACSVNEPKNNSVAQGPR